jgi:AcrR family transcriptional regulator
VSPKALDPKVRAALVEAAARLIAEHVPLTTRRLAAEIGTSTTAVYTHFGSMDDLRRAVRREGYARFTAYLAAVPTTRDPVTDLYRLGLAYAINAVENEHLWRAMFFEERLDDDDRAAGAEALAILLAVVERCIASGRFTAGDTWTLALHIWATTFGLVSLAAINLLSAEDNAAHIAAISLNLFVGFGDRPDAARRSIRKATKELQDLTARARQWPAPAAS